MPIEPAKRKGSGDQRYLPSPTLFQRPAVFHAHPFTFGPSVFPATRQGILPRIFYLSVSAIFSTRLVSAPPRGRAA